MKILKIIILGIVIIVFEYSMFQISTEIGLVSLFLICVMLSIWTVLKKITTVIVNPELIPSSTPFRDSPNSTKNDILPESQINYDSGNLIPGVNTDIFEQFREKLNLNTTPLTLLNMEIMLFAQFQIKRYLLKISITGM